MTSFDPTEHPRTGDEEAVTFGLVNGAGVPQTADDLDRAARVARGGS